MLEMINTMHSNEFSITQGLAEEVGLLADVMENKRYVTQYGGGFIDQSAYQHLVAVPAFPGFLKERLIYNYKNRKSLYEKRYEELNSESAN